MCMRVGFSQTKNGFLSCLALSMKFDGEVADLVVDRFHALGKERAGVLDP